MEKIVENGNRFDVVIKSKSTVSREGGNRDQWNTYSCTISRTPSCDCLYFLGHTGKISKHIIWTLINLFQIPQGNSLLYQVALTEREFAMLKMNVIKDTAQDSFQIFKFQILGVSNDTMVVNYGSTFKIDFKSALYSFLQ